MFLEWIPGNKRSIGQTRECLLTLQLFDRNQRRPECVYGRCPHAAGRLVERKNDDQTLFGGCKCHFFMNG